MRRRDGSALQRAALDKARASFLEACELDVAVRKPGNVSHASDGHGMQAAQFSTSALASVDPLFRMGARVGERIEGAVAATARAVGCNTNLGIVLLCAPVARAVEQHPGAADPASLRAALASVLADLDLSDARAAYRAIALANPGGLGTAAAEDVLAGPSVDLRAAMALAAERDLIARQYRDDYCEVFEVGLPELAAVLGRHRDRRLARRGGSGLKAHAAVHAADMAGRQPAPTPGPVAAAVQRIYLGFLATQPDSHIVRKHGGALAQTVMRSAQPWWARSAAGEWLEADPAFAQWDRELKSRGLNPGTSADLTVAALFVAGILVPHVATP